MSQNDASIMKGRPKLAEERLRHHWSQRELADQIGTTIVSVSRWERGITEPGIYYRQQLAVLFGKSAEEIDLLLAVEEDTNHPQAEHADDEQPDVAIDHLPSTPPPSNEREGTRDSPELSIILATESLSTVKPPSSQLIPIASQPLVNSSKHSNRQRLLNKVHMFWIRGLLEHSLQKAILIQLGLLLRPEAVLNPWHMILTTTSSGLDRDTEGMRILDIYNVVAGELLILGLPGSGKTTLLLELTTALLQRADEDETHPIPVIFNLSSWGQKAGTLSSWLIDELSHKYHVPKMLGQQWIEQDLILPLLDGLDEVATRQRTACIEAINTYRQTHGLHPMVVCSRQGDYFEQEGRLLLRSAVSIQALTAIQVEQYLHHLGEPVAPLRAALSQDPILQELTTTPFLLSILTLAYADRPLAAKHLATTREHRLQDIFTLYVQQALERRWKPATYSQQDALHWLRWLARQMQQHHDSIFYLEAMQPDWLSQERYRRDYTLLAVRLLMMLLGILILFSIWAAMASPSDFGDLIIEGLVSLVIGGLLGGLLGGRTTRPPHFIKEHSKKKKSQQYFFSILVIRNGLVVGVSAILLVLLAKTILPLPGEFRAYFGIACGLTAGIMTSLRRHPIIQPIEKINWSWQNVGWTLRKSRHIQVSFLICLAVSLMTWVRYDFGNSIHTLNIGLEAGTIYYGFMSIFSGITHSIVPEEKRSKPNYGIRQSFFNGLLIGGISVIIIWVVYVFLSIFSDTIANTHPIPIESYIWFVMRNVIFLGITTGLILGMLTGGLAAIQHFILRILLWREGSLPWRYPAFLDAMAECMLLQKVGGGYLFIHRLLLDYFAAQEDQPEPGVQQYHFSND